MMIFYHGSKKTKSYFEGWYFKCQTKDRKSIALIPAVHMDPAERKTVSIQIITEDRSWWLSYPWEMFQAQKTSFDIQIGTNVFSESGIELSIHEDGIDLEGRVFFGPFRKLRKSIMGPFRFVPRMECAHEIISMKHDLWGKLMLNGVCMEFEGGVGYIESDRGRSFPSSYLWVQDMWPDGSILLAIAKIPLGKLHFNGCICEILLHGQTYRMASYLGAKVTHWSPRHATLSQGRYRLEVRVLDQKTQPLKAPSTGTMSRIVHETLCATLHICFLEDDQILLDRLTENAGFECDQ